MPKFLVSFEVDDNECFDMIARNRALMGTLGERLAEICIAPGALHWSNRAGLSMYGIENLKAERIEPTPDGAERVREQVSQPIRDEQKTCAPPTIEAGGRETAPPMDGTPFYALVRLPMRYLPYKPNSEQRRRGIKGRWQAMNDYGGWENCAAPNLKDWEHHPDYKGFDATSTALGGAA